MDRLHLITVFVAVVDLNSFAAAAAAPALALYGYLSWLQEEAVAALSSNLPGSGLPRSIP